VDDDGPDLVADEIDFCMANIEHPGCTLALAGRFYEDLAAGLRAMAISYLLLHADSDGFHIELIISGHARRHYLARCAREGYSDFHRASSRAESFFDAVAAHDWDLARDIAALSPPEWLEGAEYEDDSCYARFLYRYLSSEVIPAELEALLVRFEVALEGASSARLDLCKALLGRTQKAFDAAFDELIMERQAEIEEERSGIAGEDVAAALRTHVFIEGLAILAIAERAGLQTGRDYPLCPALARLPMTEPRPADTFPPI
jgi:hypothetical protein